MVCLKPAKTVTGLPVIFTIYRMRLRWKIAQWFELKWWQNYLGEKDAAAYKEWKRNYWLGVLEKSGIQAMENCAIADLGCGPAGIFMVFPDNAVTAVDPLLDDYEKHTTFFRKSDYPNVSFITAGIEDFEPAQKYDLVFCMNAINHVLDMNKAFSKLKSVCKDEGTIVLSIDSHNHSFFKHLFRCIPGDVLHPHQYDLKEYTALLASDGWRVKDTMLLKREFFFNHYVLVASKLSSP